MSELEIEANRSARKYLIANFCCEYSGALGKYSSDFRHGLVLAFAVGY